MRNFSTKIGGRIKLFVENADGSIAYESPWIRNLILTQGLNNLATVYYADLFKYCAVGTGAQVTQRTGGFDGTTTRTASMPDGTIAGDTTITANAASFDTSDVGRRIRWTTGADAGYETTIATYISATQVYASEPAPEAISSGQFKIFYVEQTGLTTESKRSNEYSTKPNDNSTTQATTTPFAKTLKRSFLFPAETAQITYKEIGFSNLGAAGNNLNIRVNLNPSSNITVNEGQRLRVTYSFKITPSPTTSTAGTVSITDSNLMSVDKSGHYIIEKFATSSVTSAGDTDATTLELEPAYPGYMAFSSDTTAIDTTVSGAVQLVSNVSYVPLSFDGDYVTNSFTRNYTGLFDLGDANRADLKSLALFAVNGSFSIFRFLFNQLQAKTADYTLSVQWSKNWDADYSGL